MVSRLSYTVIVIFLIVITLGSLLPAGSAPLMPVTPVSDSMEPTVSSSDLIFVTSLGSPDVGDTVLFHTPEHELPAFHRVVETTEEGFITQGDANPVSDQDAGYPVITEENIIGTTITVGGHPLIVPYLGAILSNTPLIVSLWIALAVISILEVKTMDTDRRSTRAPSFGGRTALTVSAIFIIVFLPLAIMALPATVPVTTATTETVTEPGVQPIDDRIEVYTPTGVIVHHYVDTGESFVVTGISERGSNIIEMDIAIDSTDNQVMREGTLTVYTYPKTLPTQIITGLAVIHPGLAAISTSAVLSGAVYLIGLLFIDPKQPLRNRLDTIRKLRKTRPPLS